MVTLLEMEKMRQKIVSKFFIFKILAFLSTIGTFLVIFIFGYRDIFNLINILENESLAVKFIVLLVIFIAFIIVFNLAFDRIVFQETKEFRYKFKQTYLKPYIENLGYTYNMYLHINAVYLVKSMLFPQFTNQYGDDNIRGFKNGVLFSFSDIRLEDREDSLSFSILFEGLFFMANFNKDITSKTFVMQNKAPRVKHGLNIIEMDNPIFNTKFKVYSDNIQNAMYILSPALMEHIMALSNHMKCPINISFIDGYIFISIETGKDNFEPHINESVITKNQANKIKQDLEKILAIVDVLSLDSKLWANIESNANPEISGFNY